MGDVVVHPAATRRQARLGSVHSRLAAAGAHNRWPRPLLAVALALADAATTADGIRWVTATELDVPHMRRERVADALDELSMTGWVLRTFNSTDPEEFTLNVPD